MIKIMREVIKMTQQKKHKQESVSDYSQNRHADAESVKTSVRALNSIESLYKALNDRDEIKDKALLMLMLRSWLTEVLIFDPATGYALPTGLDDFLDAIAKLNMDEILNGEKKDRIYRIASHTNEAVWEIMRHTRDKILREHVMLPIYAAREIDSNSFSWISRRPGRNIREKLSGKPYIKAVRRRFSLDTTENRLLKDFLFRLEQILIERQKALGIKTEETCEEMFVKIRRWLRSEDAAEIGRWGNLPPNNILLQDKHYGKVWDAWLWLQRIDESITEDSKRIHRDILGFICWTTLSLLNHTDRFRIVQQPINLDYDEFSIEDPELKKLPIRGYLFQINGESANNITPAISAEIIPAKFSLSDNEWNIQLGVNNFSLNIDCDHLIIRQGQSIKGKLKIDSETLKEIPKKILSIITC